MNINSNSDNNNSLRKIKQILVIDPAGTSDGFDTYQGFAMNVCDKIYLKEYKNNQYICLRNNTGQLIYLRMTQIFTNFPKGSAS